VALLLIGQVISKSPILIFIGLAMNGFAIAGIFVPIIPMLVQAVELKYR
jgi:hypothetical protein